MTTDVFLCSSRFEAACFLCVSHFTCRAAALSSIAEVFVAGDIGKQFQKEIRNTPHTDHGRRNTGQ